MGPEPVRLFAAVALPTFLAMLVRCRTRQRVARRRRCRDLNERYLFYVVPLMFVGFALWVREGMPRRRPWVLWFGGVVLPPGDSRPDRSPGLQRGLPVTQPDPLLHLSLSRPELAAVVAAFVLLCGAVWLHCSRARVWLLWIVVATWMSFVGVLPQ